MPAISPFLWFATQAEDAAKFYLSVFPNSRIHRITRYTEAGPGPAGSVLTVDFELDGRSFTALNGGPHFTFSEAISFVVHCKDQQEIDRYWAALSAEGREGDCGWLKDKFGLSWQVVPALLPELIDDADPVRATRVMKALYAMKKLDIATLQAAYDKR